MKKTRLVLISVIILVIFTVIGIFMTNYGDKDSREDIFYSDISDADMTIKNIHYTKTNRGIKEWELKASSGQYFRDEDQATFKDLMVTVFLKDGKPLTLVGDEGRVATDSRDVEMEGNIVVHSGDRYEFHTESLKYSSEERRVFTPDKIAFTGFGMEIKGVGISIDIDRERFFILDNVSTILRPAEQVGPD